MFNESSIAFTPSENSARDGNALPIISLPNPKAFSFALEAKSSDLSEFIEDDMVLMTLSLIPDLLKTSFVLSPKMV